MVCGLEIRWERNIYIKFSKNRGKFLINSFITEFDSDYNVMKNIKHKIDLTKKNG